MIFASGLKYVGVGTTALGWILCGTLLGVGVLYLVSTTPWKTPVPTEEHASVEERAALE